MPTPRNTRRATETPDDAGDTNPRRRSRRSRDTANAEEITQAAIIAAAEEPEYAPPPPLAPEPAAVQLGLGASPTGNPRQYPAHISEVLCDHHRVRPGVRRALRTLARSGAWRGTLEERLAKLMILHGALCEIYGVTAALVFVPGAGDSGASTWNPSTRTITLVNRLSVITYLHEFAHALGRDEYGAAKFSLNLFRRHFPQTWARLSFDGHFAINVTRATAH